MSLCVYRNNLTVMEFLVVQGQGSYERLRVGGKAPGPGGFLRFKMTESLLKDCTDSEWPRIQFVVDPCIHRQETITYRWVELRE